jgi:hypothetical protein
MLMATTLVSGGDVTIVVAARTLMLGLEQRCKTFALVQMVAGDLDHGTLAGAGRFHLDHGHD